MSMLTERIPILVAPEQRARLDEIARCDGTSVGAVVRRAIEAYTAPRRPPRQALDELYSLDAPVADWPQMKAQIIAGGTGADAGEVLRELRSSGQDGG